MTKSYFRPSASSQLEAVSPLLVGTRPLAELIGYRRRILHAGPPIGSDRRVPLPVLNSAIIACLFEGWATDRESAKHALLSKEIPLEAAQDCGVLVPLAGVASPSMAAHTVIDASQEGGAVHAVHVVVNEGNQRALRLGKFEPSLVTHWRWLSSELAEWLDRAVQREPIELLPLADESLMRGDDCHSVTAAGSVLLIKQLSDRIPPPERVAGFLHGASAFALNPWMAATKCALGAVSADESPDMVVTAGANGLEFGIQVASARGTWLTEEAGPPMGDALAELGQVLGAIGDSAVIDLFGLGAMSIRSSSTVPTAAFFEPSWHSAAEQLLTSHPGAFHRSGQACGLSVRRVMETGIVPRVVLGQIDAMGERGRVGGGVYTPSISLFEKAWQLATEQYLKERHDKER